MINPNSDVIVVDVPFSKSIINRSQIINALQGVFLNSGANQCGDVRIMRTALTCQHGYINIGHCGTAMRFLTAYYAQKEGSNIILYGSKRMSKRPIGQLVDMLCFLGADIKYLNEEGYPPLQIKGKKLHGGKLSFDELSSSQYISALMMIAPYLETPLSIDLKEEINSRPYVDLTATMMCECGAQITNEETLISIANTPYQKLYTDIEGDWSAASYWYGLCALTRKNILIRNLSLPSDQGDSKIVEIFNELGVQTQKQGSDILISPKENKKRICLDLSDNPDIAQTLMVACCCLGVAFSFVGLESLQYKECDRLKATQKELAKLGYDVAVGSDWAVWYGNKVKPTSNIIETYDDHRMAMSFALAATKHKITIKNKACVEKSFPSFWDNFSKFGLQVGDE